MQVNFAQLFALYPKLQRPEHNCATSCILIKNNAKIKYVYVHIMSLSLSYFLVYTCIVIRQRIDILKLPTFLMLISLITNKILANRDSHPESLDSYELALERILINFALFLLNIVCTNYECRY